MSDRTTDKLNDVHTPIAEQATDSDKEIISFTLFPQTNVKTKGPGESARVCESEKSIAYRESAWVRRKLRTCMHSGGHCYRKNASPRGKGAGIGCVEGGGLGVEGWRGGEGRG